MRAVLGYMLSVAIMPFKPSTWEKNEEGGREGGREGEKDGARVFISTRGWEAGREGGREGGRVSKMK